MQEEEAFAKQYEAEKSQQHYDDYFKQSYDWWDRRAKLSDLRKNKPLVKKIFSKLKLNRALSKAARAKQELKAAQALLQERYLKDGQRLSIGSKVTGFNSRRQLEALYPQGVGEVSIYGSGKPDTRPPGKPISMGRYTFAGQGRYRRKKIEGLGGWWKGPGFKSPPKRRGFSRRRRVSKRRFYHRNPIIHQKRQLAFMKRRGFSKDEKNAMSLGASLARASEHNRSYAEKTFKKRARFASSSYDPEGTLLDSLLGANDQPEYKDTNSSSSSMMSKLSIGQL